MHSRSAIFTCLLVPVLVAGCATKSEPTSDEIIAQAGALAALLDDRALRARLAVGARAARDRLPSWDAACSRFADALERVAAA